MADEMRAVVCESYRPYDELEIKRVPRPGAPGPGEVRLRVRFTGVSWATTLMVSGRYQRDFPMPFTPGSEVSGEVIEAGEGAGFAPGDRVCAALDWGGYAEEVVVHSRHVHAVPDGLPLEQAVLIPIGWLTAWGALVLRGRLKAGDRVLVQGAAGGVGLPAVQIAKALGAEVFAVARGPRKAEALSTMGADRVIDPDRESFRDVVMKATGGRGVDIVYDTVGGDVFDRSLRCLDVDGRLLVIGFVEGRIPQVPANLLLIKDLHVSGFNVGRLLGWTRHDDQERWADLWREGVGELMRLWSEDRIEPVVHAVLPLERFREAMAIVTSRQAIGRVVLEV
jgi:NADPH2:quinone reductase